MLSLDNTYAPQDVQDWVTRLIKGLKNRPSAYVCNPKIDGLSLSLVYENGRFTKAATRGDGDTGEDVTLNARTIKSIPLKLWGNPPSHFEVRGEVYINPMDFQTMNEQLLKEQQVLKVDL